MSDCDQECQDALEASYGLEIGEGDEVPVNTAVVVFVTILACCCMCACCCAFYSDWSWRCRVLYLVWRAPVDTPVETPVDTPVETPKSPKSPQKKKKSKKEKTPKSENSKKTEKSVKSKKQSKSDNPKKGETEDVFNAELGPPIEPDLEMGRTPFRQKEICPNGVD